MPHVLRSLSEGTSGKLGGYAQLGCSPSAEEVTLYAKLVTELELNSDAIPFPLASNCNDTRLKDDVDEPDHGMDQNLPETSDPGHIRKWMGGTTGSASQGFRHMIFPGWSFWHPFRTFQIPTERMGTAPDRVRLLARRARNLMAAGHPALGLRVLGWALHYVQDLAQPFHTVKYVTLRMVPWYEFLTWPNAQTLHELLSETARITTNYHWVVEGYVATVLEEAEKKPEESPFATCLEDPARFTSLRFPKGSLDLATFPERLAEASEKLAPEFGSDSLKFFGKGFMKREVSVPANPALAASQEYAIRPDLTAERQQFHQAVCETLANASIASDALIEWALQP